MNKEQATSLVDAMIPGHANRWPAASDVLDIGRMAETLASLLPADASAVPGDASAVDGFLAALSAERPETLRRLTETVYAAYYTSPAVQAVIRDLAESGPRDPSPDFDESLLSHQRARALQPRKP